MSEALAERAVGMWEAAVARYGADRAAMHVTELVAIGFEVEEGGSEIVWFELPNVAERGEFLVEPEAISAVLVAALNAGLTGTRYLWHSHYISEEPSYADVSNFPAWIDAGMVFHTPSGQIALYNAAGIISTTGINSESARDNVGGSGG